MTIIEISSDKVSDLYETIEKALKYTGKAMACIEELQSDSNIGERRRENGRYSNRGMGYRDYDEDWDEDDDYFGERRGRSRSTGRYVRR